MVRPWHRCIKVWMDGHGRKEKAGKDVEGDKRIGEQLKNGRCVKVKRKNESEGKSRS